jgi:NADPH:quinone reductase-like Zn-dependent oxidoreductase
MKQTLTIPETFLGVGYTKDRAGLPLEAVRVLVPRPEADQVLIRVAASSLNPLEYKLAELNFLGRTPPVILGLDLSGIVVATGSAVRGVAVGDAVVAMADLNGDGGWVAGGGGEGGYALARGVGPGKTTRIVETVSPVDSILAERGAKHININILRYRHAG